MVGVGSLAGHRQPEAPEKELPAVRPSPACGAAASASATRSGSCGAGLARAPPTCPPPPTESMCTTGGWGGCTGFTTPTPARPQHWPRHRPRGNGRHQMARTRRAKAGASGSGAEARHQHRTHCCPAHALSVLQCACPGRCALCCRTWHAAVVTAVLANRSFCDYKHIGVTPQK